MKDILDIDFVAFAITGLLILIVTLAYMYWGSTTVTVKSCRKLTFPGLESREKVLGNLGELTKDGGLQEFLVKNHGDLGPIFSFYWGKDVVVSIASPLLFKDVLTLFDRPVEIFQLFKPFIGNHSIQYINSPEGNKHRKIHDRHYSFSAIKNYFHLFVDISKEFEARWKSIDDKKVPLSQHMLDVSVKSIIRTSFGIDYFKSSEEILELQNAYHLCWDDMEARVDGNMPEPGSERQKNFDKSLKFIKDKVNDIINHRRALKERSHNFLDVLLEEEELYDSYEKIEDMVLTYMVGGFHTTGYLLTWMVYYICLNPEVEHKLREEVKAILGDEEITFEHCENLKYMKQVIDETLRCSVLAPYAARCSSSDIVIGGHTVPKNTPIILTLGTVLQDNTIWPEPSKFNPDRFNPEEVKMRHSLAFQPFGFAGKRKCPGYRFAYYEVMVYISSMLRNFKIKLIDGEKVSRRSGLVTSPKEEIWINVECL